MMMMQSRSYVVGAIIGLALKVCRVVDAGFVRGIENLECASILFSESEALKVLEFPELALKSLEFCNVNLFSSYY